ncbi:uncharacterized protein LOC123205457 [Mangifera indica]|uniref:uncharacterized protein LOC123205457 n=1 Tax=Mangifera indica TaxID=29780 RepID=UPI001CFACDAC|nr:uncharacterized protein LOC123205457 [Mangifera indica]
MSSSSVLNKQTTSLISDPSMHQNSMVATSRKTSGSSSSVLEHVEMEGGMEKRASWNSFFTPKKSNVKLEFFEPKGKDSKGRICVAPPQEVAEQGALRWNTCAVGFFLGKRPPFLTVKRALERVWKALGLIDVMTSGQGVFILKFQDMEGTTRAVEEGQITIQGQPFLVRKWTTNLPMVINDVKKVAIWIRMYGIPLEFWTPKGLSYIASAIGSPLYMDSVTEEGTRLEYARVCIEIEVDSGCPDSISLALPNGELMVIKVEYAWKPIKCNGCQCFGHSIANCSLAPKQGNNIISRNTLKEGDGFVVPKKMHGKDKMVLTPKGYDKKSKDKGVEMGKTTGISLQAQKSNRFSALTIKEPHELEKEKTMPNQEVNYEANVNEAKKEGKRCGGEASTSKEHFPPLVESVSARESEEGATNTIQHLSSLEDMDQEASPVMAPFGGKLKVDEMDFRK